MSMMQQVEFKTERFLLTGITSACSNLHCHILSIHELQYEDLIISG